MKLNYLPEMPEHPRPIVILGTGGIVRDAHLPAYKLANFPVHGVYNRTRERAERVASDFGVPNVYGSVEEAVAAAPGRRFRCCSHAAPVCRTTLAQLPDGAPVLIQKPMGDDWPQGLEILQSSAVRNNCKTRSIASCVSPPS